MLRRLSALFAIVSAVVCLATAALWIRSTWFADDCCHYGFAGQRSITASSIGGTLWFKHGHAASYYDIALGFCHVSSPPTGTPGQLPVYLIYTIACPLIGPDGDVVPWWSRSEPWWSRFEIGRAHV